MSEKENQFSSASYEMQSELSDLESAFTDPFVEHVLELGRTYNKIFLESAPTDEEIGHIVEELDAEWGTIIKSKIRYTGNVDVALLNGKEERKNIFFDGTEVTTNGFIIDVVRRYENGEEVDPLYVVKHHLLVPIATVYGDDIEVEGVQYAVAKGDITNSLLELDSASPEHARAWLSLACPELIDEIDGLVLNAEEGDEQALLSLAEIDLSKYSQLEDDFLNRCVEIYLSTIIEIDLSVPYSASLDGYMYKADESHNLYSVTSGNILVNLRPFSIVTHKGLNEGDEHKKIITVPLSIIHDSVSEPEDSYVVPIATIKNLQSIRKSYYAL
jgi:hypothetical protein